DQPALAQYGIAASSHFCRAVDRRRRHPLSPVSAVAYRIPAGRVTSRTPAGCRPADGIDRSADGHPVPVAPSTGKQLAGESRAAVGAQRRVFGLWLNAGGGALYAVWL